jgi:hypothetical protein
MVVAISANAIQAAPVGLAVTISTAATITGTAIATTATSTVTKAIAMTTLQKTVIAATLIAAASTGIYEARQASTLRHENQLLQQQQAPIAGQSEQLQREKDQALRQLASLREENQRLKQDTAELLKLRGEVARLRRDLKELAEASAAGNNPLVQTALKWKAGEAKLRQLFDDRPEHRIPELSLLDDRTYFDVAKDADLETEAGIRTALSRVRFIAENQIAVKLQAALQQFTKADEGRAPQNVAELATFIDPPIDKAIFDRYGILNTGTNVAGGWSGGWVISQKKAVDSDYDSRWLISPRGFGPSEFKKWER